MSEPFQHYMEALFQDDRLTKLDCEVFFRLRSCRLGYLAKQEHMARWTGKAQGVISRSLKRLMKAGWVTKTKDGYAPIFGIQDGISEGENIPHGIKNIPKVDKNIPTCISAPYIEPINNLLSNQSALFQSKFEEWLSYKKKIRKTLKEPSILKLAEKWAKLGDRALVAAVDHSIAEGYTGLFAPKSGLGAPPKETKQQQSSKQSLRFFEENGEEKSVLGIDEFIN